MIKLGENPMNPNLTLILIIIYLLVIYLFTKYYKISQKLKEMHEINAKCSDIVVRRTYNKKYYLYFYTFTFKKEEYSISEKYQLPLFQKKMQINKKYPMAVDSKNPQQYVSPNVYATYKYYLYFSIFLILISFLLFI